MSSGVEMAEVSPGLGGTAFDENGADSPNIFAGDGVGSQTAELEQPSVFADAGDSQVLPPSITDDELLARK